MSFLSIDESINRCRSIWKWQMFLQKHILYHPQHLLPCIPSFLTTVNTKLSTSRWGDDSQPESKSEEKKLQKCKLFITGKHIDMLTDYLMHYMCTYIHNIKQKSQCQSSVTWIFGWFLLAMRPQGFSFLCSWDVPRKNLLTCETNDKHK